MEEGDIVMIYVDSIKCEHKIDQAKLIKRIFKFKSLEYWQVEYTNEEGKLYDAWVRVL